MPLKYKPNIIVYNLVFSNAFFPPRYNNDDQQKEGQVRNPPSAPWLIFSRFFDEILLVALKSKPWYRLVKSIVKNMLTEQNKNVREKDCFQL